MYVLLNLLLFNFIFFQGDKEGQRFARSVVSSSSDEGTDFRSLVSRAI